MDNINDLLSSLTPEDISSLKSMAESLFSDKGENEKKASSPLADADMLLKISNAVSLMNSQGGSRSRLIEALKPNLSEKRQKKADEAMQILKLLDIIPIINSLSDKE